MAPSPLNPAHESFVIVQSDDEGIPEPVLTRLNASSKPSHSDDFTFVGGVYPSLVSANEAALSLAAKKCNCSILPTLGTATSSRASSISSASASSNLGPTATDARPQLVHQKSADGRYLCRCKNSEASNEDKAVKFEVRKIEVRPLGSRMGWSFSDDDA